MWFKCHHWNFTEAIDEIDYNLLVNVFSFQMSQRCFHVIFISCIRIWLFNNKPKKFQFEIMKSDKKVNIAWHFSIQKKMRWQTFNQGFFFMFTDSLRGIGIFILFYRSTSLNRWDAKQCKWWNQGGKQHFVKFIKIIVLFVIIALSPNGIHVVGVEI